MTTLGPIPIRSSASAGHFNKQSALRRVFKAFAWLTLIGLSAIGFAPWAKAQGYVVFTGQISTIYLGQAVNFNAHLYTNSSAYFWDYSIQCPLGTIINPLGSWTAGDGSHDVAANFFYTPTAIGNYTFHACADTDLQPSSLQYGYFNVNVVGPNVGATLTASGVSDGLIQMYVGQTMDIHADFVFDPNDPSVGTSIDISSDTNNPLPGTHAPGQDESAKASRDYIFLPTAAGNYTFFARMKTQYVPWATYMFGSEQPTYMGLTVNVYNGQAPTFTVQPVSQTVGVGSTVTFSIAATGDPKLSYSWQVSTDGGVTWSAAPGGDPIYNTALTISNVTLSMNNYHYRCGISNDMVPTPIYSQDAILSVSKDLPPSSLNTVPTLPPWALVSLIGVVFFVVQATFPKQHSA